MQKELMNVHIEVKALNDNGTFSGLAAVYGNVDLVGDVIERGAFTRTLADRKGEIKLLYQHNQALPIGKGKLVDTPAGLQIEATLALGISAARDAYEAMKAGIVDGLSIGYDVIRDQVQDGKRFLKEIRLHEVSLVTFPANPLAVVSAVKGQSSESDLRELSYAIKNVTRIASSS